jgi:hypothetical protein
MNQMNNNSIIIIIIKRVSHGAHCLKGITGVSHVLVIFTKCAQHLCGHQNTAI